VDLSQIERMVAWVVESHGGAAILRLSCGKRVAHTNRDAVKKRNEVKPIYRYDARVLEALAGHGLVPRPETPPGQLRDAVRDLYRYEIKRLRLSLLAGHIARRDYAGHVVTLRRKYPLLSVPTELWLVRDAEGGEGQAGI
jgi:hypothetical protein